MPAVAVVAGIASAVGGAAAFTATFTLANVAAGLAVVGGISTALGAVTGNKKLQKFGMIAGVGALAAGGIAALTSTAGNTAASTGTGLAANAAGEGLQAGAAANTGLSVSGLGGEVAGASFGSEIGSSLSALDTGVQIDGLITTSASHVYSGSMDQGLSDEQLLSNFDRIERELSAVRNDRKSTYDRVFAPVTGPQPAPTRAAPAGGGRAGYSVVTVRRAGQ